MMRQRAVVWCGTSAALAIGAIAGTTMARVDEGVIAANGGSATPWRAEFRVSTFVPSAQEQAALTRVGSCGGDELVAVWASRRQNQGKYGVYAQRLTAEGVAIGTETPLAVWTESHAMSPSVAGGADGRVIAAWQSFGQDGDQGSIIARVFTRDGDRLVGGNEVLVNQTAAGDQTAPVVAVRDDGRAIVAWLSGSPDGTTSRVMARVIRPDGTPIGDEFVVSDAGNARTLSAGAAGHTFAVAYASTDETGLPAGVRVRTIGADGAPGEGHDLGIADAIEPVIAGGPGGFVVAVAAAEREADGGIGYGIVARRVDHSGRVIGSPIAVHGDMTLGVQNAPTVAFDTDGSFVVAFNGPDGDKTGVVAHRFAGDGSPLGPTFEVTGACEQRQELALSGSARAAILPGGTLAVAWSGAVDPEDKSGAAITLMSRAPLARAERGVTAAMHPASAWSASAGTAEPHIPPTFDPKRIDHAPREVVFDSRGIGFDAVVNTGWTPPDPHMAVGPSHVVVMTNGAIAAYRKSDGANTFQNMIEGAAGFWGALGATGFVFDPEVLYDGLSGRFFAMAAEGFEPGNTSHVLIAVSDDSDPNGTWHKYRLSTTAEAGNLFDSPNIAVTGDAVIVTGDGFGISANYPYYTWDKASMLAGLPPVVSKRGTMTTTTQSAGIPAVSYDAPPALYMIEHKEAGSNTSVRLVAMTGLLTTPSFTFFNLTVPSYAPPGDPAQQGTTTRPESFDARFWSAAYRGGSLWATHHAGTNVKARWYEVAMNGWPTSGNNPTLTQSGVIDPAASVNTSFSAINVSPNGNAAVVYAYSSPTNFLSVATSQRRACDPLGQMDAPIIHKVSNAAYTAAARWGDYSAVQADPSDPTLFWAVHEYALSNSWRTWVQSFTVAACSCPADFNGDGFVNGDDFDAYVLAFEAGADAADFNHDGFVTGDDFDAYVLAFQAGC